MMGKCTFCNQPAGFLKKHHKECLENFNNGKRKIILLSKTSAMNLNVSEKFQNDISTIAKKNFISNQLLLKLVISGWEKAVESAFDDGILTKEEENNLLNFAEKFSFEQHDLDKNGYYSKIIKGAILREIMEGTIPERVKIGGTLPFNFLKKEKLVWIFQNVDYYEEKTQKHYTGGHQGFSIRIAKGVYYRVGTFKGHPVETSETLHIDNGIIAVTNKHIYFSGRLKNFRIRYNRIITFKPYSDGIVIQRDSATAKPQIFLTGDGWFTYNLLTNLSNSE